MLWTEASSQVWAYFFRQTGCLQPAVADPQQLWQQLIGEKPINCPQQLMRTCSIKWISVQAPVAWQPKCFNIFGDVFLCKRMKQLFPSTNSGLVARAGVWRQQSSRRGMKNSTGSRAVPPPVAPISSDAAMAAVTIQF